MKQIKRMKELLLYAQLVAKTTNIVISRCFFRRGRQGNNYCQVRAVRAAGLFFTTPRRRGY